MPEFSTPFCVMASERKLTDAELVRAVRLMVAAEYEAIQLYMQLAESTDNTLAQQVLTDVADEERVHAGEFLRLLKELAPDEEQFYQEGYNEVEEEFLGGAVSETGASDSDAAPGSSGSNSGLGIGSLKQSANE